VKKSSISKQRSRACGTSMAVNNLFGFVGALIPWALGLIAGRFGLRATMWLLLLGPLALLIGLPFSEKSAGR